MLLVLVGAVTLLYLLYSWLTMRPKNFPPGPPHLPLVGCIPFVKSKLIHLQMEDWRRRYGSVVGLLMGPLPVIAVVGPDALMEVLKRDEFQARPDGPFFRDRSFGKRLGIFFTDGLFWVEQRRFALRHLRDFGFGKTSMENLILEEAQELNNEIRGKVVQVSCLFNLSTTNVLWSVMAGSLLSRKDPELQRLMDTVTESFRAGNPSGATITNVMPILQKIFPEWSGDALQKRSIRNIQGFLRDEIRKHEQTLDEDHPRDFIDVYLTEMNKHANTDSTFTEEGLIVACMDLFTAGSESVGNTLGFCVLYLVLYPEVQRKVQAELDAVVGRERKPLLQDRPSLQYVEAVLAEVSRINTIAPLCPPHRVTRDTELNGYFIPKDITVLPSIWCVLHDEKHWGDPAVFRPERFLNSEGKFVKDNWLIPFGLGKRLCAGEPLARNNLYLFFTTLLHEFTFSLPEGDPKPSTISLPGLTTAPKPFQVQVTQR